jgi:hypothetical protein
MERVLPVIFPKMHMSSARGLFFRIVHLVNFYDVPPELIINMDQTGVMLLIANNKTYNEKGARQVDISGRDEKRA